MCLGDEAASCGPETGARLFVFTGNESSCACPEPELLGGQRLKLFIIASPASSQTSPLPFGWRPDCLLLPAGLHAPALCVLNQAASSVRVPALSRPRGAALLSHHATVAVLCSGLCPPTRLRVRAPSARGTENKGMTDDGGPSQGRTVKKVCAVRRTIRTFRRAQCSASCWKPAEEKRNRAPDSNRNVKREETYKDGGRVREKNQKSRCD